MEYIKDKLSNTSLPILIIEEKKTYHEYPQIGYGDEGSIHGYNDEIALKLFKFIKKERLPRKFEKIEHLGKLHDPNACFPIGLVGYEDEFKEGYYFERVNYVKNLKDFFYLKFLDDTKRLIEYLAEADAAIKRFHEMGLVLGDIKDDNIMIDINGNVKFVDTDNWKYQDFDFDTPPCRKNRLKNIYNKDFSLVDNDKFVYGMMCLQCFVEGTIIDMNHPDRYFELMIELMDVNQEVKDGLRLIFSDANDKPYIGPILKKINPEQKILSREAISRINCIF